jgi:hypothetical protein
MEALEDFAAGTPDATCAVLRKNPPLVRADAAAQWKTSRLSNDIGNSIQPMARSEFGGHAPVPSTKQMILMPAQQATPSPVGLSCLCRMLPSGTSTQA